MISKNLFLIHLRHLGFYAQIVEEHLELGVKYGDKSNSVAINFIKAQRRDIEKLISEHEEKTEKEIA